MGTRHVTDLLSAAYDGALTPAEQRRWDEHLAACPDCTAAAGELRQSIDALRALPKASMPSRVVLPTTPPQAERRRRALGWPARLPRPVLSPAWGAGTLAAAGIVLAVLAVHGNLGGSRSLSAGSTAPQGQSGLASRGGAGQGADTHPAASIGTCPLPLAVVTQPADLLTQPLGFTNSAVTTPQERPGQKLVLATTVTRVSPGEQVLIYAALTSSGGGARTAVIPCVSLHSLGAQALAPANGNTSAGSGAQSPGSASAVPAPQAASVPSTTLLSPDQVEAFAPYDLLPPLAVASPTSAAVATLPLQVLRIPTDAIPGTTLQLVALVPSGLPSSGDHPAVEAVLTLDVS